MERALCESNHFTRARSRRLRAAVILLCTLLVTSALTLSAAQLTAQLDRDTITLGEAATLSLTFEGSQSGQVPSLPGIPNLKFDYTGQSSQVSVVNGAVNQTFTHSFQVTAKQPGEYIIPALTVNLGGEKMTTLPLKLRVLKPAPVPQEAINAGTQPVFVKLVLPKQEIYLGEPIVAELQFYFRQGTQVADWPSITATPNEGFSLGQTVRGQQRSVQIGNVLYVIVPEYLKLLPNKTGPLSIGPITAAAALVLPGRNWIEQARGGYLSPINFATETGTVQCLPLPTENAPSNFNGAVGDYQMSVTAGPTNVATGDPITVRVRIAGHGSFDALTLPPQSAWHDFNTYPPTSLIETVDQLGLQGAKTFEQIVSPQTTDIKELPAFSFSFFDPDAKQYRTLTQPPIPLIVRPGGVAPAPVIAANSRPSRDEIPPTQQDIVPIKERLGTLARVQAPLIQQPWFVAAQSVPVLAFLGAFFWRKRTDNLANNPRLRRQRQVARIVGDGLIELRRLSTENKSDDFFATLVRILQEQIGERLDLPASAITEAIVDERLKPAGLPDAACASLHELFQTCNLTRYAPIKSSQEFAAIVPQVEQVVTQLKELKA